MLAALEDCDAAAAAAAAAKSLQSCPTLCDPIDGSPPGSPVSGILQARTLEWVAISFSNAWKWKVKVKPLSCVQLFATPWPAAHQAPPSMGFFRQEYWSGVPSPSLQVYVKLLDKCLSSNSNFKKGQHSYKFSILLFYQIFPGKIQKCKKKCAQPNHLPNSLFLDRALVFLRHFTCTIL